MIVLYIVYQNDQRNRNRDDRNATEVKDKRRQRRGPKWKAERRIRNKLFNEKRTLNQTLKTELKTLGGQGPDTRWRRAERLIPGRPQGNVALKGSMKRLHSQVSFATKRLSGEDGNDRVERVVSCMQGRLSRVQLLKRKTMLWKQMKQKQVTNHRSGNPKHRSAIRAATLNCKGTAEPDKKRRIEEWANKNRIDVLLLTETQHAHTSVETGTDKESEGKRIQRKWKWYFSSGVDPQAHDIVAKQKKSCRKVSNE